MQILDLTNGKYSNVLDSFCGIRLDEYVIKAFNSQDVFNKNFLFNRYYPGTMSQKLKSCFQEVPVFLVETSMSKKTICIPGTNVQIDVPADSYIEESFIDESFDGFFRRLMEEPMDNEEEEYGRKKKGTKGFTITDLLGVYISTPNDVTPSRIFVWIDKICECALQNQENSLVLLEQVILHEYAHALMDVSLYGYNHTTRFHYSDYPYRYIEEACANAISLWCGFRHWSSTQQAFIESFVKKQPKEYAAGWDLYDSHRDDAVFEFWMQAKVQLDRKALMVLDGFWKSKDFHYLFIHQKDNSFFNHDNIMLIEPCGQETWAYKERSSGELLGLIWLAGKPTIICTPKYNSFWSFDSDNLCMVRLDKPEGYKYGYINIDGIEQIEVKYDHIYSFENGLAVAKLGCYYGVINEQDEEVVPFDLDYPDMRELRNGYATMKGNNDKWGAIDAKGNVVIPCEYDSLVIFNEEGVARVEKSGKEFFIDTKGNLIK